MHEENVRLLEDALCDGFFYYIESKIIRLCMVQQ